MIWAEREPVQLVGGSAGDLAALLGVTDPVAGGSVAVAAGLTLAAELDADESTAVVVDGGACGSDVAVATTRPGEAVLGVLRGPCYLGLQTLGRLDTTGWAGLLLVREPGRALDRRDVEDIGGIPVLAAVEVSPVVARVLDSGLALGRLGTMREFAELHAALGKLIERPMSTIDRVLARHGRTRTEPCESTYTDWHLAHGARCRVFAGLVLQTRRQRRRGHIYSPTPPGYGNASGGEMVLSTNDRIAASAEA